MTSIKDLALEAVLLFHSASPWDAAKVKRWNEICNSVLGPPENRPGNALTVNEATTRKLCDIVRKALE